MREGTPLCWESLEEHSVSIKLANMRKFLASGQDPNKLDPKRPDIGRPLHFAITDMCCVDLEQLRQNLPIVKLLLEAGADPRLPNRFDRWTRSPLEELANWLGDYEVKQREWPEWQVKLKPFYEAAYKEMRKVADRLDGE